MDNLNLDMCGDWFSSIDDLLNFPCEDFEGDGGFEDGLKDVWQTSKETLSYSGGAACDSSFSTEGSGISSSIPTELPVPCDDIAQLEWLSNFVEDSFSAGSITPDEDSSINKNSNNNKESNEPYRFQTSSPISVLSNNSCSEVKTMPVKPEIIVPGRARSKRPRPATFTPRPIIPLIPTTSLVTNSIPQFPSAELVSKLEKSAESRITLKLPKPVAAEAKKRKKAKISPLPGATEQFGSQQVRKCLHCEITKTPQWRAGPLGPKTLCNACGVRYKSGRLFPEYRPAASPTFVSTLHSNSHKKVLEMRTKGENSAEILSSGSDMLIEYDGREDLLF